MVSELFFAKFLEIVTIGLLEIGKFLQKQSVSIFRATVHTLHLTGFFQKQTKVESCWVFCTVTFSNMSL